MEETPQNLPPAAPQSELPKGQKNTGMAVVAYILFFIPLLTDAKNDPFVKFHVKQGFLIFLSWVIAAIIGFLPLGAIIAWILNIAIICLFVVGIMNALKGEEKQLPFIGKFADKVNF